MTNEPPHDGLVALRMPDIGAADQPITLVQWLVDAGADVEPGDRLLEVVVSGVLFYVPAPEGGVLVERIAASGRRVSPGDCLGWLQHAGERRS